MKKAILIASAALALVACTQSLENELSQPKAQGLVFEGGFQADTKVAFDQEKGGVYPLVWSKNDAIGIFSYDMTTTANVNIQANLVRGYVGQSIGVFIPVDQIIPGEEGGQDQRIAIEYPESGKEKFFIYYPYSSKTDINVDDGKVHGAIAEIQSQDKVSDKQVGKNGFSCAMTEVSAADKKVNFTLRHTMAYLRFVVTTSDYAGYELHGVQLYDANGTAAFGGEFTVDPVNATAAPVAGKTLSSVKAVVENHDFTATGAQEIYLTVIPGDFSAADCKVVVTFMKADGTTASIPTTIPNLGNIPAGSMTTINVSANKADNKCAWYEPEESRDLVNGWAYGPQNTYFIESKASGLTDLTIDVKARGDFSKVREPKYYGWLAASDMPKNDSRKLMQFPDGGVDYESVPTRAIGNDYTVTVQCLDMTNGGHWAVLAIYDKDYNILWNFTFCKYFTDDPVKDVTYPGTDIVLMDRALGTSYSPEYAIANKNGNPDIGIAYFQWGRPAPFMWSNANLGHYTQAYVSETNDFAYAISHPQTILASQKGDEWDARGKWYVGETIPGLWGAVKEGRELKKDLIGKKTIYDPCPKGYRVMDDKVALAVNANALFWEVANGVKGQEETRIYAENPFKGSNASVLAYPLGNDKYDYWYYAGAHWGSNSSWGNRVSSNNRHGYLYWTNSCNLDVTPRVGVLQGVYFSTGWGSVTDNKWCDAYPVRCQKDEYGK